MAASVTTETVEAAPIPSGFTDSHSLPHRIKKKNIVFRTTKNTTEARYTFIVGFLLKVVRLK